MNGCVRFNRTNDAVLLCNFSRGYQCSIRTILIKSLLILHIGSVEEEINGVCNT